MPRRSKLLLAALTTALVFSIAAGAAAGLRSLSIVGEQMTTLTGRLLFVEQGEIRCSITMTKRFNRVIAKTEGAPLGNVTRVTVEGCTTIPAATYRLRSITFLGVGSERQWSLLYKSFLGALPEITGILYVITRMQILIDATNMILPVRCLFENPRETTIPMLARLDGAQEVVELRFLNIAALLEFPLLRALEGSGMCSRGARIELELRPTQATRFVLI